MDSTTYQKIIRHHGWDYCEHDRVRRFCEECKWDVPAFLRIEPKQKKGTGKANSQNNNAQFQNITGKRACQSPNDPNALEALSEEHRQEEMERKEKEKIEHPDFSEIA
ncbi:MAG: hypothetical protein NTZ84_01205 [Candidatus Nealsonbacteria bacterium]|nr:hypothetical protein [Candidatus Nealsonbacteria bacterium]